MSPTPPVYYDILWGTDDMLLQLSRMGFQYAAGKWHWQHVSCSHRDDSCPIKPLCGLSAVTRHLDAYPSVWQYKDGKKCRSYHIRPEGSPIAPQKPHLNKLLPLFPSQKHCAIAFPWRSLWSPKRSQLNRCAPENSSLKSFQNLPIPFYFRYCQGAHRKWVSLGLLIPHGTTAADGVISTRLSITLSAPRKPISITSTLFDNPLKAMGRHTQIDRRGETTRENRFLTTTSDHCRGSGSLDQNPPDETFRAHGWTTDRTTHQKAHTGSRSGSSPLGHS